MTRRVGRNALVAAASVLVAVGLFVAGRASASTHTVSDGGYQAGQTAGYAAGVQAGEAQGRQEGRAEAAGAGETSSFGGVKPQFNSTGPFLGSLPAA